MEEKTIVKPRHTQVGCLQNKIIMKTEKLTWLMFIALIAVTFGVVAFTAPQLNNQILAGFMSAVFVYVLILTSKN